MEAFRKNNNNTTTASEELEDEEAARVLEHIRMLEKEEQQQRLQQQSLQNFDPARNNDKQFSSSPSRHHLATNLNLHNNSPTKLESISPKGESSTARHSSPLLQQNHHHHDDPHTTSNIATNMNVPHVSSTTSPKASLPTTATTTASKFQEENSEQQLPSDKPLASHPYFTNHPRLAQQPQHQQTRTKSPHNTRNNSTAVTTMSNKPKSMNHQKPTPTTTLQPTTVNTPVRALSNKSPPRNNILLPNPSFQTNNTTLVEAQVGDVSDHMLSHHKTFTNAAPPKSNIYSPSSHSSEDGTIFELCGFSFSSIAQAKTFILSRSLGMNPQQEEWQKVFQTVKLLNLHQNSIPKMDGLSDFVNIQELNLSSNNIEKIEGLNCLEQLRVLNLSANRITKVEGLGDLKKLRKLVLSFNKISSLEGLHFLHGPQYNLQYLDVRGNNIENLNELTFIFGLHKIRELYFQNGIDGSFNNPVCKHDRYRPILLSRLALREQPSGSLEIIDGFKISIVKEQSQPSKRQIILNYQHGNTTSDDEEFDGSDTLTSPYVSKYVKYLKNSEQEQLETATVPQALPPQNSNTKTPLRNETVEVAISTHEKNEEQSNGSLGQCSTNDSVETISQFIGSKKTTPKKRKQALLVHSEDEMNSSIDANISCTITEESSDSSDMEEARGERSRHRNIKRKDKQASSEGTSQPQTSSKSVLKIHIRDENTQTDISSSIFDEMLRFRSINLFDEGIQTEPEISSSPLDSSHLTNNDDNNSVASSTKSERDSKTIAELRKTIEELCKELGSSNVYIQHREQEIASETSRRRKLEEELAETKSNCSKLKKKITEISTQVAQLAEENTILKEHDSQLQKELERTKSDAYALSDTKDKELQSMKKECEAIILALKKKIDLLTKNHQETLALLQRAKEEHSSATTTIQEDMTQKIKDLSQQIIDTQERCDREKRIIMDQCDKQIQEIHSSHKKELELLKEEHSKKIMDWENISNQQADEIKKLKNSVLKLEKKEHAITHENEELRKIIQKQKEKLTLLLQSKQEGMALLVRQLEEKKQEQVSKEKLYLKELDKVSNYVALYKNQAETLQTQIKETEQSRQDLLKQLEDVKKENINVATESESLRKDFETKEREIRCEYEKKIQTIRDDFKKDQEAALLVKNTMLNDNNDTIRKQKEELNKLRDKVTFLEKELDREIREKDRFFRQDEKRDEMIESLERELQEAKELANKEKTKRQRCRDELNERISEISSLQEQIEKFREHNSESREQLTAALKNLEMEKQHNKELTLQLARVESNMLEVSQATKKKYMVLDSANQELRSRLKASEEKKKLYAQHIVEMEETIKTLKEAALKQAELRKEAEEKVSKFKAFIEKSF